MPVEMRLIIFGMSRWDPVDVWLGQGARQTRNRVSIHDRDRELFLPRHNRDGYGTHPEFYSMDKTAGA
jgi:hypothetical protein